MSDKEENTLNEKLSDEFAEFQDEDDILDEERIAELTSDELEEILHREKKRGRTQGIILTLVAVSVCVFIAFFITTLFGGKKIKSNLITEDVIKKSDYLWKMIDRYYLWEEDENIENAQNAIYSGIVDSLGDPYSVYYTKEEFEDLLEGYSGEYSGIGAYITQNQDTLEAYISRPMADSPAEEAGLKANDYIYEVDGENVLGQDLNLIVSKIKGPEGTEVKIGVKHENEGEIETFTVTRRTIEVAVLESEMIENNIGYIWIYEFEDKTKSQFDKAYTKLKEDGMEGLIVDLRDNPGGDVEIVVSLCDEFLEDGMIIYSKDKNGKNQEYTADAACEKLPIVIITNENSASAAEIFTGALKDRGVAKVVGKTTFGKGIIQAVFELPNGDGLKITEAEYYLPSEVCIHGVGIKPDYEVELDYEAYKKDKTDAQKDKAIEVMKELLK